MVNSPLSTARASVIAGAIGLFSWHAASAQVAGSEAWSIELEAQQLRVENNQVQRPNDEQGTRFDVTSFAGRTERAVRVTAFMPLTRWNPQGALRLVIVPFSASGTAVTDAPLRYDGATFQPGKPLTVDYRFNTYRLSYLVPVFTTDEPSDWDIRAGGTLAVRDAQIKLSQGALVADFSNVGPVPLFYMSATRRLGGGWRALGEFDAFPAPGGGGLFDGSLKVGVDVAPGVALNAGLRVQVGAARDPEIFNSLSTWAFVAGVRVNF